MILKKALLCGQRFGHSQGHETISQSSKSSSQFLSVHVDDINMAGRLQDGWEEAPSGIHVDKIDETRCSGETHYVS